MRNIHSSKADLGNCLGLKRYACCLRSLKGFLLGWNSQQHKKSSREGIANFSFYSTFLTLSPSIKVNNSETKRAERNFDHWNLSLMGTVGVIAIKWRMINALLYKTIDKELSSSWMMLKVVSYCSFPRQQNFT